MLFIWQITNNKNNLFLLDCVYTYMMKKSYKQLLERINFLLLFSLLVCYQESLLEAVTLVV